MRSSPFKALAALTVCGGLLSGCLMPDVLDPTADPTPTSAIPAPSGTAPFVPTAQIGVAQPMRPAAPTHSSAPAQTAWGFPAVPRTLFGSDSRDAVNVMPAEEVACRKRLKRLGVRFRDIPRIRDSASCGIDWPVEVTSLGRTIKLAPAAKLNCAMAEEAARWAQKDLAPAARTRYLSGIAEIRQMSSYSCRRISGSRTISEHAKGNALDIGAIKLKNGRTISVHRPGPFAFRERSFLRKVRGEACGRFGTVLGPGYNRDHADHFHLDLKQRRNVVCR